ncbi:FHA domain-containing protein [Kineococcus rhizosphaerae]|uniref:PSer/pThr/pTyr-binding forkhead associated (FHA) protein n=1 Tax=Kineococcus rhizosphaerae TaxID=559628 RepID=A0A2T0R9I4_9ACTN|nr:FHA domain-containing protein [Kineococcus rhizosphaerae]PRY17825.1 pSer/pThr/pTyr-binding forkhead associated (FHA) protein [Kineococcus rhizosphaerae]
MSAPGSEPTGGPSDRPDEGTAPDRPAPERPVDSTMSFAGLAVPEVHEAADRGLTSDDTEAIEALPAGSALLVVRRGPNAGSRFLLDAERTSAGRHQTSDIFLDDVTVSRKHAEFLRAPDPATGPGFRVRDVGSLNGTYVNRERIDDVLLSAGDEVQIGKYRLEFHPSPRVAGRS